MISTIAAKNLFQEKTRFLISIGGVAFSVLLMIFLQALNIGFGQVMGEYLSTIPTDLWVAHVNTGNIMDPSILPLSLGPQLRRVDGVASAKPLGTQSVTTEVNDKDLEFYLIAYDQKNSYGKLAQVSGGKTTPDKGEIIVDRITAKSNHVKLGDHLVFARRSFKVVGFSEGTYMMGPSIAFVNIDDSRVYTLPGTTNYWLVNVKSGFSVKKVQDAIAKQVPGVTVHTKAHFDKLNVDVIKDVVVPVFMALVLLGALIGTAVIGLTIFTSTIEKSREYGILKAIGLKNRQLYLIVLEQAIITAVIGFALGVTLALILNPIITNAVPQFITQIRAFDIAWISVVTLAMAVVSSYIPIRRMSKIDPAEVFKA